MRKVFAIVLGAVMLSACGAATGGGGTPAVTPSPTPAVTPTSTPTSVPSPSPSPSPSPTISPAPSPTAPAGYACGTVSGGAVAGSGIATVRVGQHPGYDRFVIEFTGGVPSYTVAPQSSATFTRSPKGDQVTLEGTSGVLITVHMVTNWTSYSGPTSFRPGYPYLRQAVMVQDYEGYQQWALGVKGTACVSVSTLSSPSRLVVDVIGI